MKKAAIPASLRRYFAEIGRRGGKTQTPARRRSNRKNAAKARASRRRCRVCSGKIVRWNKTGICRKCQRGEG